MNTIITPAKLMTPETAVKYAERLKASDPEWTFLVKHDPKGTGFSFVEVYDEQNEFVGVWSEWTHDFV